jgi:hypothetical protein
MPERRVPAIAGFLVILLALPVFLAGDWPLSGWALGAGLWLAGQVIGFVLGRRSLAEPTLRGSGPVAFGMLGRGIILMVAVVMVATFAPDVAVGGALVYAAGYTVELALTLTNYYSGSPKR